MCLFLDNTKNTKHLNCLVVISKNCTDLEKFKIEKLCEKLSISYAHLLDFDQYDELAELFTIDAVLIRSTAGRAREHSLGVNKRSAKLRSGMCYQYPDRNIG